MLRPGATWLAPSALAAAALAAAAAPARANPASRVPSAGDPGDAVDIDATVDYEYSIESSSLWREVVGAPVDPLDPLPKIRDLDFQQLRHTVVPRLEISVLRDTWLSVALPVVIAQQREITLGAGVTPGGSTAFLEGLVPPGGYDARDPSTPLAGDGVFRGPDRSGLDQLHLGAGIALMNQERDETKPTWKLRAELRVPVGRVMRFDPLAPESQTGVGRGIYEVRLATSFARRYRRTEAWLEVAWQAPIAAKRASLLRLDEQERYGATNINAAQRGGVAFGVELFALDDRASGNRVSLDLGGRIDVHFEGRGYSELWELFAYAGDANRDAPLVLDADPVAEGIQARSNPGVTNIENHLEMAGRAAIRAHLGRTVRFAATFDLAWKTDHIITFADAGIDLPTCGAGVSGACEDEENGAVNPGTPEVNPLAVPSIDLVGHRYHSEDNLAFVIGLQGEVLF